MFQCHLSRWMQLHREQEGFYLRIRCTPDLYNSVTDGCSRFTIVGKLGNPLHSLYSSSIIQISIELFESIPFEIVNFHFSNKRIKNIKVTRKSDYKRTNFSTLLNIPLRGDSIIITTAS